MEQLLKKICTVCNKEFPATEEFFFPSYLTSTGRNICKVCHRERAKNSLSVTYRTQLRERATPISSEQVPFYKSLNSIAMAIGLTVTFVEHDVFDRDLPVYTFIYNKVGPALVLQMEDAEAYIREHAQNGHTPAIIPKKSKVMGSPEICGCCNNEKGNILAVHNMDQQVIAYLCSACYRAARSFDWEPERLRAVAKLIETIGGNIDRSRR